MAKSNKRRRSDNTDQGDPPGQTSAAQAASAKPMEQSIGAALDSVLKALEGLTHADRRKVLTSAAAIEGLAVKPMTLIPTDAVAAQVAAARRSTPGPSAPQGASAPAPSSRKEKKAPVQEKSPYEGFPVIGKAERLCEELNGFIFRVDGKPLNIGDSVQASGWIQTIREASRAPRAQIRSREAPDLTALNGVLARAVKAKKRMRKRFNDHCDEWSSLVASGGVDTVAALEDEFRCEKGNLLEAALPAPAEQSAGDEEMEEEG